MMRTQIFQLDAFTTRRFAGNPAAVMPLDNFFGRRSAAGNRCRKQPGRNCFSGPRRRRLSSALVHTNYRGAALRPRHSRQRRSGDGTVGAWTRQRGFPFGERTAERTDLTSSVVVIVSCYHHHCHGSAATRWLERNRPHSLPAAGRPRRPNGNECRQKCARY